MKTKPSRYFMVTALRHEFAEGDVIRWKGTDARIVWCDNWGAVARRLYWFERLWLAVRLPIRLSGFWSRVWTR